MRWATVAAVGFCFGMIGGGVAWADQRAWVELTSTGAQARVETTETRCPSLDIDGKIRALDAAGQRDSAIALNVGIKPGESNYAFDLFDKALGKIIDINQSAFDSSIATAESRLAPLPWIVGLGGALVWLLAFLGLRPRLNEYRT